MSKENPIKRLFDLYTSDVSMKEMEKLIKQDSSDVYEYFAKDLPKEDENKSKFVKILLFIRNLFNAFVMKLTPERRIIYLISMFLFLVGYFQTSWVYLLCGFLLINGLLIFELFEKLNLKDEISIAKKVQDSLVPKEAPKNDFYDIANYYESAKEVSGDYCDFIPNGEKNKLYMIIGDISGKGMPAALYMVRVQAIVHSLVTYFSNIKELVISLKNTFSKNLESGYFLTLIFAAVESDGKVSLVRAGHNCALVYRKENDTFEEIDSKGMGIGLNDHGMFDKVLEEVKIDTQPGDLVFLYTDGLVEAMNKYKEQFGLEKVKNILKHNSSDSADCIITKLMQNVSVFRDNAVIHDDLTMIMLKRR